MTNPNTLALELITQVYPQVVAIVAHEPVLCSGSMVMWRGSNVIRNKCKQIISENEVLLESEASLKIRAFPGFKS